MRSALPTQASCSLGEGLLLLTAAVWARQAHVHPSATTTRPGVSPVAFSVAVGVLHRCNLTLHTHMICTLPLLEASAA